MILLKSKYIIHIIFTITVFVIACKNPFATRDPEPPSTGQSSWQFPTDPLTVLENMKSAFREKNVENYLKCLVDSNQLFTFFPDAYEASNNPGIFEQWGLGHEQSYINKLFTSLPDDSTRKLTFAPDFERDDKLDSVFISLDYTLEIHHVLQNSYPTRAQGRADFWFIRRNGYWVIKRWEDHETIVDTTSLRLPSWSTVKSSFVN